MLRAEITASDIMGTMQSLFINYLVAPVENSAFCRLILGLHHPSPEIREMCDAEAKWILIHLRYASY